MYKEEHMISIIKPRGDIKPNWESANPVLRYREWGVEWEESVGIGDVNIKIGDGVTHWNNLDYAIVNNITKKIVKNFASIIDSDENPIENPELAPGDSVETLFGKIKNKFDYTLNFINALKNMVGDYQEKSFNTGSGTVTASDLKNAIDILEQYKLTTANILDVNDSTNPDAALSANQGRLINNKVNANTNAIDVLNSNSRLKIYQYTDYEGLDNSITRPLYFVRYGKIGLINFYIRYTTEYSLTLPSGTSFPFVQTLITPTLTKDSTSVLNVYVESNYMKFSGGKVGDRYLVNFVFLMI